MLARISPRHRNRWPELQAIDERWEQCDRRQEELRAVLADMGTLDFERVESSTEDVGDERLILAPREIDCRAQPPTGPLEDDRAIVGQLADQRRPPARPDRTVDEENGLARSDLEYTQARCRRVEVEEPLVGLEPVVLPQPPLCI
jgi:hypothetical protein